MTDTATPIEAQSAEVTRAEVVDEDQPRNVPAVVDTSSAIDRAADAALAMPGVPDHSEFLTLAMTAKMLSLSGAAPKLVRNNPYVAFHVAMLGRDLGISPSAALQMIDVIESNGNPQLSLSPELQLALLHKKGLGDVKVVVRTAERAVAVALSPGGSLDLRCQGNWPHHVDDCRCVGVLGDSEFTWADAQMAGLAGDKCQPGNHDAACWKKDSAANLKCRQGWKTYPKRMTGWRAIGYAISDYFPEVSVGTYAPEELGAAVDEHGRAVDPAEVELPQGFEPERAPEPEPASDEDRAELRRRISVLPEAGQEALKTLVLETRDREGVEPLGSLEKFPARQLGRWKAVVARVESRAKAGEWGDWKPPVVGSTGEMPPATADSAQEPKTGPEATGTAGTEQERSDSHLDAPDGESPQPSLLGNPADGEDEQTKVAIALVQAMSPAKVDEALRTRGEPVDGNVDTRRRRLVVAMIRETVAQRETN